MNKLHNPKLSGNAQRLRREMTKEEERDVWLKKEGYQVFRYANSDINQSFSAVCEDIYNHLQHNAD